MTKPAKERRVEIAVLAGDGVMPSAVIGIADLLAIANTAIARTDAALQFRWRVVSADGRDVRMARGLSSKVDRSIKTAAAYDVVIVPGFLADPAAVADHVRRIGKVAGWLRRQHAGGAILGAFCTGVFVLAEAGLLNGRRATTTWWLQSELKERYPRIDLSLDAVVTEADNVVCAAGPMSWVDLLLRVIEMTGGAKTARVCADFAVLDTARRTQAGFLPQGYLLKRDPWLVEAEMLVRRSGDRPLTVSGLARALHVPGRTLHRRIKMLAGEAPQSFIARIRIEMARTLLETTTRSVKEVAHAVGYEDESSFRKAFRKRLGLNPRDYRLRRTTNDRRGAEATR